MSAPAAGPVGYPLAAAKAGQRSSPDGLEGALSGGTVGGFAGSARRLGRRGRAALREELSSRDLAVLADVGRFRLLTSRQVELLHFADAATDLTAARITRRVLRRLTELNLLYRLDRQVGGLYGGSAAFAYALTAAGQRLLDEGRPDAPRRLREPSPLFVRHTLAVAELYVRLVAEVRAASDVTLLDVQTEPACWRRWTRADGSAELLRPDLYLALAEGLDELRWFVEVDLTTEHRPALQRKCRAYQRYMESGVEQTRDGVFPQVLWVTPDARRADQIGGVIRRERGLTDGLFAVTTADAAAARLVQ